MKKKERKRTEEGRRKGRRRTEKKDVPGKHANGPPGVLFRGEDDGAEAARAAVGTQRDVGADNRARLAEQVLEVLPLDVEWQLQQITN
jgi:hypothetical protein